MNYLDLETYEKLYRRFILGDRSEQMLDLAGDLTGKVFLDICCGGGRLTNMAMDRKTRRNIMIDSEARMISKVLKHNAWTEVFIMTVEDALREMVKTKKGVVDEMIDVAMCQQGINYWLTQAKAGNLSRVMSDGGVFIFNTFNKKPDERTKIREYSLERPFSLKDDHYVEVTWRIIGKWDDIQHVQICQGEEPHFTKFKWMSDEYIRYCLETYFDVELIKEKATSIYKCIKKERQ